MKDKRDLVKGLKEAGAKASDIFLATDPDREGEAISWHLQAAAGWDKNAKPPKRVVFHEITKQAVEEAFEHPREIDMELVNAQQARRILDRLVGYEISPLLWLKVQLGLSAGRVQSVALRMIVEREREISAFVPVEWWTLEAELFKATDPPANPNTFTATLHSQKGARRKLSIPDEDSARSLEAELKGAAYSVDGVEKKPRRQRPAPPFITSTLQQDAGRKLRFTAQRTMALAQQLYEGLNVGSDGSVGLITYMRTRQRERGRDGGSGSARVHQGALRQRLRAGQAAHLPDAEQERPRGPRGNPAHFNTTHAPRNGGRTWTATSCGCTRLSGSAMVASQMADALLEATTVEIDAQCAAPSDRVFRFRATGSVLKFPGFRAVYLEGRDDSGDAEEGALPELAAGDGLVNQELQANQHFTQPPPRFTEATLIKEMEEKGIGASQHLRADHCDAGGTRVRAAGAAPLVADGIGLHGHRPAHRAFL